MSKLNKMENERRKILKMELAQRGGAVASDGHDMTAAWIPTCKDNGIMSLARCGFNDEFYRKRGELVVLFRVLDDYGISMKESEFEIFCDIFGLTIREEKPIKFGPISRACDNAALAAWPLPAN